MVLVSSAAATLGSPGEYVHYAASKAAVDALTVGLAKELADAVAWLLGEHASYVTGTVLRVSGGL
jgi:NAD(P)-dependent dehydrogenase (short-subunit alcohol dehydrogenase family)